METGPLANFKFESSRLNNTKVSSFLINGNWNVDMIIQKVLPQFVPVIFDSHIQYQPLKLDQICCKLNYNGEFSCSSAWELIRNKRVKTIINSYTWHKSIPFKCSFHLWRTLRGKLPTNEKLISLGQNTSECYSCYRPGQDTIGHIFVVGHFARNIWSEFATSLGITRDYTPLRNMIMRWWTKNYKNDAHKLILQSTTIFIYWNLWKNWCACKYGGKQSNLSRGKFSIFKATTNLLNTAFPYIKWPVCWKELVLMLDNCSHEMRIAKVY